MYRIMSLYIFFIYILPFTLLLNVKYIFEYYQVMTILIAFYLGGFVVKRKKNIEPIDYRNFYIPSRKLLYTTAIAYFIVNYHSVIDVFMHLIIYHDYTSWALENAVKRYANELYNGPLKKISSILFIMYMIFLGAYGFKREVKNFYLILLFMLIIESSALARAGVLIGFIAYFSELLIRYNYYFSTIKTIKLIKIGLIVFIVIAIIFFFSAYFRVQNENNIGDILVTKVGEYILSTYEALLIWMQNVKGYGDTYGFSTFTGLYKIVLNIHVKDGFYGIVQTDYGPTVIYTVIRGLIADFGYSLTTLIVFLSGIFIKYYMYTKMSYYSYFYIRLNLFLLLFMLYSPFLFATILIGYSLAYFILILTTIKLKSKRMRITT